MDWVKFLRDAEQRTRQACANVNPCADISDGVKLAMFARAEEWKACADKMERLQTVVQKIASLELTKGAAANAAQAALTD